MNLNTFILNIIDLLGLEKHSDKIEQLRSRVGSRPSAFEEKQSTTADAPQTDVNEVFESVRPQLILDQGSVDKVVNAEAGFEHALGQVANLDIKLTNEFEDQYNSRYLASVFPWALNYNCGGPEYPHLFAKNPAEDAGDDAMADPVSWGIQGRWRRRCNVDGRRGRPAWPGC